MPSLAEFLGLDAATREPLDRLEDIEDPKAFGMAVMNSVEFRRYILLGLQLGNLPGFTGILRFYLEHALGKPPDKLELTGKDGQPMESIVEVRRVVVRPAGAGPSEEDETAPAVTH